MPKRYRVYLSGDLVVVDPSLEIVFFYRWHNDLNPDNNAYKLVRLIKSLHLYGMPSLDIRIEVV